METLNLSKAEKTVFEFVLLALLNLAKDNKLKTQKETIDFVRANFKEAINLGKEKQNYLVKKLLLDKTAKEMACAAIGTKVWTDVNKDKLNQQARFFCETL